MSTEDRRFNLTYDTFCPGPRNTLLVLAEILNERGFDIKPLPYEISDKFGGIRTTSEGRALLEFIPDNIPEYPVMKGAQKGRVENNLSLIDPISFRRTSFSIQTQRRIEAYHLANVSLNARAIAARSEQKDASTFIYCSEGISRCHPVNVAEFRRIAHKAKMLSDEILTAGKFEPISDEEAKEILAETLKVKLPDNEAAIKLALKYKEYQWPPFSKVFIFSH